MGIFSHREGDRHQYETGDVAQTATLGIPWRASPPASSRQPLLTGWAGLGLVSSHCLAVRIRWAFPGEEDSTRDKRREAADGQDHRCP